MKSDSTNEQHGSILPRPLTCRLRRECDRFLMAIMFLTRLRVPPIRSFHDGLLADSVRYFPAVGALIGVMSGLSFWAFHHLWSSPVAACLTVILSTITTGAFHEDGLADAVDAFGGGFSSERVLEIMKDSRIGTYGALALILSVLLRIAILASLSPNQALVMLITAHVGSRCGAILVMWLYEYARADASSKSKPVVQDVHGLNVVFGLLSSVVLIGWLSPSLALRTGVLVAVIAIATGSYYRKRLGGYTGDCLGMTQQITELAILLTA